VVKYRKRRDRGEELPISYMEDYKEPLVLDDEGDGRVREGSGGTATLSQNDNINRSVVPTESLFTSNRIS
jgi:hypothetical protein